MLSRKAGKDHSRTHLEPLVALSFLETKAGQLHLPDGEHVPQGRNPSFAFGLYWSCPSPNPIYDNFRVHRLSGPLYPENGW